MPNQLYFWYYLQRSSAGTMVVGHAASEAEEVQKMARPLTNLEKQVYALRREAEKINKYIEESVEPDWRLIEVRVLARDLTMVLAQVDLSGPAKPIIPVRALEVKKEYISRAGFPVSQFGVRDDWDGTTEWPS